MPNQQVREEISPYHTFINEFLLELVPKGPNIIMDLGCASGQLGRKLLQTGKAAELIGVELFAPAANKAIDDYKIVHIGNIEEMHLEYSNYFDVVVCGDIIEHLKEPFTQLGNIYRWLKPGGKIICSIPNIRYWRIWRDLILKDEWEYTNEGILDRTHLRFFTASSFKKLLLNSSFTIDYMGFRMAVGPKQELFNKLTFGYFEEFLAFQALLCAHKT